MDSKTPSITSINPPAGTSAGGTEVTITGTGFGTVKSDIEVVIESLKCEISSVSDTLIKCITAFRNSCLDQSFDVKRVGYGSAATNGYKYSYLDRWSDTRTWGGEAPPRE